MPGERLRLAVVVQAGRLISGMLVKAILVGAELRAVCMPPK